MCEQVFTDADSFQLDFPKGIDASAKARMLGTTAFVNMIFFEEVGHYRVHPSPPERCPQGSGAVLLKIEQTQLRLSALHS